MSKKTVLIIEDESAMSRVLDLKLSDSGYNVISKENGQEALGAIEEKEIDLILLDLVMPKMDGFEFLENIGDDTEDYYIMVLSNLSQEGDEQRALELGADEYNIKSKISVSEIINKLEKINI